jgi:hypothetical protein
MPILHLIMILSVTIHMAARLTQLLMSFRYVSVLSLLNEITLHAIRHYSLLYLRE